VQRYLSSLILYVVGFFTLAAGLALGNFLMSAGTVILLIWFLIQGKKGLFALKKLPQGAWGAFLIFMLVLLPLPIHGYSEELLHDLRIKLPLLLLPLILLHPNRPKIPFTIVFIWLGIVALIAFGAGIVYQVAGVYTDLQFRKLSPWISNVRMGTLCALTALLLIFFVRRMTRIKIIISIILSVGLVVYMLGLQTFTGLGLFALFSGILLLFRFKGNPVVWSRIFVLMAIGVFSLAYGLRREWNWIRGDFAVHEAYSRFKPFSADGYPLKFEQEGKFLDRENGFPVWSVIAPGSLHAHWPSFSPIPLTGQTSNGQELYVTLVRYLSSKGLSKDLAGLTSLSSSELIAIENGTANALQNRFPGIVLRTNQTMRFLQTYIHTGDPHQESLCIRLEIWRLHLNALRSQWLTGFGPGKVEQQMSYWAERSQSSLHERYYWMQSHQQLLSITLYYGVPGLILFLLAWLWMGWRNTTVWQRWIWIFYTFAMLWEDVLHTQAGITQLLFFYCIVQHQPRSNDGQIQK